MELDTNGKQIFAAVWAILEILAFGGLLFGWGSLVYVLKKEQVYANLCDFGEDGTKLVNDTFYNVTVSPVYNNGTTHTRGFYSVYPVGADIVDTTQTCVEQDRAFNLGFAITTALFTYGNLAASQINYKFGTRVTRLIFIFVFVVGSLLLAFESAEIPWLVFPGMLFVGVSGIALLITNVQVAYLFTRGRSILVALLSGALDTSVLTQLCVKFAYEGGISILYSYIFIAVAHCVTLISTFLWLPKSFLETTEKNENDEVELKKLKHTSHNHDDKELPTANGELVAIKDSLTNNNVGNGSPPKSLRNYILSSTYLFHVFWFSILQLRFFFFIGSLNQWLTNISEDDKQVSHLTNVSLYAMLGGIFASFLAGVFYDSEKRRLRKCTHIKSTLGPPILPLATATLFGITLTSLQLVPHLGATYATFVVLTLFRAFLYSIAGGYLSNLFPSSHFGILYGVMMSAAGTIGFLQYALFSWMESYTGATDHERDIRTVVENLSRDNIVTAMTLYLGLSECQSNTQKVNIFFICLVAVTFIHPLHLWIKCRRTGGKELTNHIPET